MLRVLALPLLLAACFTDPRTPAGDASSTGEGAESSGTQAGSGHGSHGEAGSAGGDTTAADTAPGGTWEPASTGDAGPGDPGSDGACALYCGTVLTACSADGLGQYPGAANCVRACEALPPGDAGDMNGNSLACRREHAALAIDDPATHCVHAGPGGAGVCGTNCEGFCAIAMATCPEQHPELGTCLETCTAWSDDEPYDIDDATGDTLACRLYHLMVAVTDAPSAATHCPHTTAMSTPCK